MAEPKRRNFSRPLTYAAVGVLWCAAAVAGALVGLADSFGPPPLGKNLTYSKTVLGSDGDLLRAYLAPDGRWRLPASRTDVDPRFLEALFAYEDKRFYDHHGVDPLAMTRALYQFARRGEIVSGGSTITMQVARLLEPRQDEAVDRITDGRPQEAVEHAFTGDRGGDFGSLHRLVGPVAAVCFGDRAFVFSLPGIGAGGRCLIFGRQAGGEQFRGRL